MLFGRKPKTLGDWQQEQVKKVKSSPPLKRQIKENAKVSSLFMLPSVSVLRTHDWSFVVTNLGVAFVFFAAMSAIVWFFDHN